MSYDKRKMQDIIKSEKNLWVQYLQCWQNSDANQIWQNLQNFFNSIYPGTTITIAEKLKYKFFDAFNWNRIINLVNDQTNNNIDIKDWSNTTIYNLHDLVIYNGFIWNSKQNSNVGNIPQLGDFWNKVDTLANAQGGEIAWENDKTYSIYNIISYNGYMWVSKQDNNIGNIPQFGSTYWQQIYPTTTIKTSTYDSLVGKWKIDYGDLKQITDEFKYVGTWQESQNYEIGNLVNTDTYHSYFCLQKHTSSANNQPPNTTYWIEAETMLDPVGIQVSETAPTNLTVGDIYFQIIT